jgi:hypothetical protein
MDGNNNEKYWKNKQKNSHENDIISIKMEKIKSNKRK